MHRIKTVIPGLSLAARVGLASDSEGELASPSNTAWNGSSTVVTTDGARYARPPIVRRSCRSENGIVNRSERSGGSQRNIDLEVLKVGTWNCTSFSNANTNICKEIELCEQLRKYRMHILALTGTKLKQSSPVADTTPHGYRLYLSRSTRPVAGVGFAVANEIDHLVSRVLVLGDETPETTKRVAILTLKVNTDTIHFVCVYAPHSTSGYTDFIDELGRVLNAQIPNGDQYMILGDLNCHLGTDPTAGYGFLGKFCVSQSWREAQGLSEYKRDSRGEALITLGAMLGLRCLNTFFNVSEARKYTYQKLSDLSDFKQMSRLDLIIASHELAKKVSSVRVRRGAELSTDHYLVVAIVRLKAGKVALPPKPRVGKAIKWRKLADPDVREEFNGKVSELLAERPSTEVDLERQWVVLRDTLVEAARVVCGEKQPGLVRKATDWWSEGVRAVVHHKRACWRQLLRDRSAANIRIYRAAKQLAAKVVKHAKCLAWSNRLAGLQSDFVSETTKRKFWQGVQRIRGKGSASVPNRVLDRDGKLLTNSDAVLTRWKEHFDHLLNGEVFTGSLPDCYIPSNADLTDSGREISLEELVGAIRRQKGGTAPGCDGIRPEFVKALNERNLHAVKQLFNCALSLGRVPNEWNTGVIVPLFKKGNELSTDNYRGITLLSVVGKLYASILERRLRRLCDHLISESQGGFRPGRSCVDQLFTLHRILEEARFRDCPIYTVFIDLEKAYDRVPRDQMFESLLEYGASGKLLAAIKALYADSRCSVRLGPNISPSFPVKVGLRQGCVLSPLLFSIYMDRIMRSASLSRGVRYDAEESAQVNALLYADDLVLIAESSESLQSNLNKVNTACLESGMKINTGKTEAVVFAKERITCNVTCGGCLIKQVESFKYLGTTLHYTGDREPEIRERVLRANNAFFALLKPVFGRPELSRSAKLMVHKGIIRPILMYGHEVWDGYKNHLSKIRARDMAGLRWILGVRMFDRIRNEEICRRLGVRPIDQVIIGSQLRWMGHVARMNSDRLAYKVHYGNFGHNWRRGRPKRSIICYWKDLLVKMKVCAARGMQVKGQKRGPLKVLLDRDLWSSLVTSYCSDTVNSR